MPQTPPSRVVLSGHSVEEIVPLVQSHGFTLVESDPDLIICHGGDGTLIGAEREWPGVPKVSIQRSDVCKACPRHTPEAILKTLAAGEHTSTEHMKIRGEARGETLIGINEVLIHNAQVTSAVRYVVDIDGVPLGHEIIGDGLVVATPFGSSAYFRSITNSTFLVGIGLAFNNSTEPIDHLVLSPDDVIRVRITRGPALLASDNNPHHVPLD
ncbi:NAD(+)/NADH kinase, partial [Candidatus Sumerlaeota bacterium]|nr:NAD(+)/NADH kinase [Candidatus Sumerlaeota bacterium]